MKNRLLILKIFASVLLLSTTSRAQYCIPEFADEFGGGSCADGDGIDNFVMTGSGIEHYGSGCSPLAYGDFSADPGLYGTLQASVSYNLTITHNYMYSQFTTIWIDYNNDNVFDDITEVIYQSAGGIDGGVTTGSVLIPISQPAVTGVRMRVIVSYNDYSLGSCDTVAVFGEAHDYTVDILAAPSCPNPIDLALTAVSSATADIEWTEQGTATDYAVEWGLPGFAPGTGVDLGNAIVTGATTYQITGLAPTTDYEFYVVANCGVDGFSYWAGPFAFTTDCVPVTTLPWTENFESVTDIGNYVYPTCWSQENPGFSDGWNVHDNSYDWSDADALSGNNFLALQWGSDAYIWTPEFELTAGETYEFVFNWAGDSYDGWSGEVLVNTSPSSAGATVLGDPFIMVDEPTIMTYQEEIYCFTPDADGIYSFAIHVTEIYYWYYLSVDDVTVRVAEPIAGVDASYDACITEGMIDLDVIGSIIAPGGTWSAVNPLAVVGGNQLDVTLLPDVSQVIYEPAGCQNNVIIDLTVYEPSSAGTDGTMDACMNQQIDLLSGLSGTVNLGGTWYNETNNALTSSYFMTGTTQGTMDYSYVADNGVCPADTAVVSLTILPCDYLKLDNLQPANVTIYPNPSNGVFHITPSAEFADYNFEVTDLNGRTIMTSSQKSVQTGMVSVDLSDVESGVYMIRVFNATQSSVFRLIKQ